MIDPLIEKMRELTPIRTHAFLEAEAANLSELAYFKFPVIDQLKEDLQNGVFLFAYQYAEERIEKMRRMH